MAELRWQQFFQRATEPIYVLNRRGCIVFVNAAWEAMTGMTAAQALNQLCDGDPHHVPEVFRALAPPADLGDYSIRRVRRRLPGTQARWWEIDFFPLREQTDLAGILARARALPPSDEPSLALPEKLMALREGQAERFRLETLAERSPAMNRVLEQAKLASQTEVPVLIVGEAGAGKRWLARAIHLRYARRHGFFGCLDAPALPEAVAAEGLLGPNNMLSTLATLVVREPAQLPPALQLRLAEHKVGARLIFTLRAPASAHARLTGVLANVPTLTIELPPLRDRGQELEEQLDCFLRSASALYGKEVHRISLEARTLLRQHTWPENFHELGRVFRAAVERAAGEVTSADLPFYLKHAPMPPPRILPLDSLLEQTERRLIEVALRLSQNNQTRTAELLAVWRPRLIRRLQHFGLAEASDRDTDHT